MKKLITLTILGLTLGLGLNSCESEERRLEKIELKKEIKESQDRRKEIDKEMEQNRRDTQKEIDRLDFEIAKRKIMNQ